MNNVEKVIFNYSKIILEFRNKTLTLQLLKEKIENMERLDKTDLQILRVLQQNAKLTTKELAELVNLSTTPVFERQKRLERQGFIRKYVAIVDAVKMGLGFVVFCNVKLRQMNHDIAKEFEKSIVEFPEVTECYNTSGNFDFLLKIHVKDMAQYREFLLNKLGTISSLGSIESTFVMSEVKHEYGVMV